MVQNHSHSITFSHGNALIFQRKFFLRTLEHRAPDPSEICALEFKGEFRRFGACLVSATIRIDWSIFEISGDNSVNGQPEKNTVSAPLGPSVARPKEDVFHEGDDRQHDNDDEYEPEQAHPPYDSCHSVHHVVRSPF
jgi:hypothetical protein